MLVIMRKTGQSLRIGSRIVVNIAECKNDAVKIGIDAPKDVPVHREEVYKKPIKLPKIY